MIPFEGQTLTQRIVTTVIIVIVILLLLSFIGWIIGEFEDKAAAQMTLTLSPSPWDAEMIAMDRQAARDAYQERIRHLFSVFTRESDAPERPMKGAAQARRTFIEVMQAIDRREQLENERRR